MGWWVHLISMRSSAVCGVVDFMGVSLLKVLGSAPRLPGKVRQLLRLRSFERSVGTFGAGGPSAVSSACFQWFPLHAWSGCLIRIYSLCLLKRCTNVRSSSSAFGYVVLECCVMQRVQVGGCRSESPHRYRYLGRLGVLFICVSGLKLSPSSS